MEQWSYWLFKKDCPQLKARILLEASDSMGPYGSARSAQVREGPGPGVGVISSKRQAQTQQRHLETKQRHPGSETAWQTYLKALFCDQDSLFVSWRGHRCSGSRGRCPWAGSRAGSCSGCDGDVGRPCPLCPYSTDLTPSEVLVLPVGHVNDRRCWTCVVGRHRVISQDACLPAWTFTACLAYFQILQNTRSTT